MATFIFEEQRVIIRFLHLRGMKPIEIHRQLSETSSDGVMDVKNVRSWVRQFKEGRTSCENNPKEPRPPWGRTPKEASAAAMQSWRERCEKCVCLQGDDYVEKWLHFQLPVVSSFFKINNKLGDLRTWTPHVCMDECFCFPNNPHNVWLSNSPSPSLSCVVEPSHYNCHFSSPGFLHYYQLDTRKCPALAPHPYRAGQRVAKASFI